MRKLLSLFISVFFFSLFVQAQSTYWQQQVNFSIDVSLNDNDHTLDGFERIEYINNSPDTLHFIWFHVWPNAYKNDKTAFSDQLLENGNTSFYFSSKEEKGYINRLSFKVNNSTAEVEDHPEYIDVIKIILPQPLLPHHSTIITTPFHVKVPYNFSRGGHDGQSYQVTQWYPKPALYDQQGWHAMPYLDQGEFYNDFGDYNVTITLPNNYAVAATGELQNAEEKQWLASRSSFTWQPIRQKIKTKSGPVKTILQKFPPSSSTTKTLNYKQSNVHDFAWFADKRFTVLQDSCRLGSGKSIQLFSFFIADKNNLWSKSLQYAKRSIRFYSAHVGDYPYSTASVVQGPQSFGGGMEYPSITVLSPVNTGEDLDILIAHELGHNWFYGALASNERNNPWMDEGMNSYYENLYKNTYYPKSGSPEKAYFETAAFEKTDQPITTSSEKFTNTNYSLSAYYKASEWLNYLKNEIGTEAFNKAMQDYYSEWQSKHPQPTDFKTTIESSVGKRLDSTFSLLHTKGILPGPGSAQLKVAFLPKYIAQQNSSSRRQNNILLVSPALGINSYDKLMIGALITNIKLPPNRLQFLVTPMYATGSKNFTGLGFINYSFFPNGGVRKIDLGVSASTFSMNEFKGQDGKYTYFNFKKLVPGIRFTIKEKEPRSTLFRYIQWKTYLFTEQSYRISYDSIFSPTDTTLIQHVGKQDENRTLNQLLAVVENNRALYPYRGELKIEQAKYFVRAAFTGKYFFNYGEKGGLDVRLFAGKFIYTGSKTVSHQFATDRYHLNMTGANGYEDYTYSDYFVGRNKFEGAASQQIMVRDGGFKIRTDLLGSKIGKTDNWLFALNLSSSIPDNINPLNLLPVKIPLKVFFDIGTYSEAWKRNANEDRFLYDAGFQIPLFKETINIYIPLVYSPAFKDYVKSYLPKKNKLLRTISFSIDISNFSLRKIDRRIAF